MVPVSLFNKEPRGWNRGDGSPVPLEPWGRFSGPFCIRSEVFMRTRLLLIMMLMTVVAAAVPVCAATSAAAESTGLAAPAEHASSSVTGSETLAQTQAAIHTQEKTHPSAIHFPKLPLPEVDLSHIDGEAEKEKLREALQALDEKGLSAEKIAGRLWAFVSSRENQEKIGEAAGKARDIAEDLIDSVTGNKKKDQSEGQSENQDGNQTEDSLQQTGKTTETTDKSTGAHDQTDSAASVDSKNSSKTDESHKTNNNPAGKESDGKDFDNDLDRIRQTITDEATEGIEKAADQAADAAAEKAKEVVSQEIDKAAEE